MRACAIILLVVMTGSAAAQAPESLLDTELLEARLSAVDTELAEIRREINRNGETEGARRRLGLVSDELDAVRRLLLALQFGADVVEPEPLRPIRLHYPEVDRLAGLEGRFDVVFDVREDGTVANAGISRLGGTVSMRMEALRAVREMRFVPGRIDGEPVTIQMRLPVIFRLVD